MRRPGGQNRSNSDEDPGQRIGHADGEVVGREDARHHVEGDVGGRVVERPAAEQPVERAALQRAEGGGLGDLAPERFEFLARSLVARPGMAVGHHGGVHGAGRRARYGFDGEPALLEQAVQHAPGEGAVRAATLQGQVDELRRWLCRHGQYSFGKNPSRTQTVMAPEARP